MIMTNAHLEKVKTRFAKLFTKSNWNLICELTRANFKVTDHNSILGFFWSLINPILLLLVLYFLFKARFGQGIRAYPLYLLVGIASVNFFVIATTYMIKIFFIQRDFALNAMVPRESFIVSNLSIHAYKFVIELIVCLVLSIFYGIFNLKYFLLLLPLLVSYIGLVLGIGLILSLLYCFARDIEHIWTIIARVFFFATPIFYTLNSILPWSRRLIYWGNPLTPFLISFRQVIMKGGNFHLFTYLYSLLLGIGFFVLGYCFFIVFENIAMERA